MIRIIAALMVLSVAGCVTSTTGNNAPRKPDLEEAARINTQLGIDYLRQGENLLAIEKLEKARSQDAKLPELYSALALAYARVGEIEDARLAFERAVDLSERDPALLNNFAVFKCENGDPSGAVALFNEARNHTRYLTPWVALTNAGSCMLRSGNPQAAERYFREALKINPEHAEAMLQLATLSNSQGDNLRARAFLQRFESVRSVTPESLLLGLRVEYALGNYDRAAAYSTRLRQAIPSVGNYINLSTGEPL